ncbi:MAG: RNA-binding transcriptional accessory protein [Proteobacteria bacterium]|nr:RNA-binding transcriptional accessory protein [Pseudomonadota bacterium]
MDTIQAIVFETNLETAQISNVIDLLKDGNTIPFIARYRKEKTKNLDELQLRNIRDRFEYITELEDRKEVVLKSIEEQGKLTDELNEKIRQSKTKQALEDLYLPYKPKKRTRATIAREKGLEPLAELMRDQSDYESWLEDYLKEQEEETTAVEARQGARDIVAEWISEDAEIKEEIRDKCWIEGTIGTEVQKEFEEQKTKFEMYYDFSEPVKDIPAHRYLAVRRGEVESVLKIRFEFPTDAILEIVSSRWIQRKNGPVEDLDLAIRDSYQRLLAPSIEVDLRLKLKTIADDESIKVFGENLKNLLLGPLGGNTMILALDPGFKSGSKWVVVDETGKFLEKGIIFPTPPQNQVKKSEVALTEALGKHPCPYICIGNGTASREIMQFVRNFLKKSGKSDVQPVIVNESGASVYSASEVAREEFPDLDVSFRGSISIGRRFQDPLAELVKIDPKAIGVGQYQHDVNQKKLKKSLDEVVESCVNYVGVNLNTASASLLSYVSGMNKTLAKNVVAYRNENGAFKDRDALKSVSRFGPKSFEQSAGFLRIPDGGNPLDQSAVHPENYLVVLKMADDLDLSVEELIGNESALSGIVITKYETEEVGLLTLRDIVDELKKPGRDPRTSYVGAKLKEEVQTIKDLEVGMELEGTVTNLTKFGAFVDLGVHQDGLVHLSEMSDRYIKEPSEVCSVGQIVKVRVLSVDVQRKRISLTMKSHSGNPKKHKKSKKKHEGKERDLTGKKGVDLKKLADKFKGV